MKVFFDLDGTLLDATQRLYTLFQRLVPASGLSYEQYWLYKRDKLSHSFILKNFFSFSDGKIKLFEQEWLTQIELKELLVLDKPFNGVKEFLMQQVSCHTLYLITARQFREPVIWQLENHGLKDFFEDIFITYQKTEKADLVKGIGGLNNKDWMVGDTGKDIETGKKIGLRTAAVLTGFLSRERLMEYNPDVIVENVMQLEFTT